MADRPVRGLHRKELLRGTVGHSYDGRAAGYGRVAAAAHRALAPPVGQLRDPSSLRVRKPGHPHGGKAVGRGSASRGDRGRRRSVHRQARGDLAICSDVAKTRARDRTCGPCHRQALFGAAWLCGTGFTMSLFIATLAFTDEALLNISKGEESWQDLSLQDYVPARFWLFVGGRPRPRPDNSAKGGVPGYTGSVEERSKGQRRRSVAGPRGSVPPEPGNAKPDSLCLVPRCAPSRHRREQPGTSP